MWPCNICNSYWTHTDRDYFLSSFYSNSAWQLRIDQSSAKSKKRTEHSNSSTLGTQTHCFNFLNLNHKSSFLKSQSPQVAPVLGPRPGSGVPGLVGVITLGSSKMTPRDSPLLLEFGTFPVWVEVGNSVPKEAVPEKYRAGRWQWRFGKCEVVRENSQ